MVECRAMTAFLLIASDVVPFDGPRLRAPQVYDLMMEHECWELSERSPFRKDMKPGDTFVFYLGGKHGRYIAGEAKLAGELEPITKKSPVTFNRQQVPFFTLRVPLVDVVRYEAGSAGIDTIAKLSFAKESTVERKYIGLLLRVGVRKLEASDLELIRREANIEAKI